MKLYAFRYRIFVDELGWMPRDDEGVHILIDEFDQCAANYAAFDDAGEVIGSLRVVVDGLRGVPLERCRPLGGYRHGKRIVELCRLAVAPEWRCTRLAPLLMKAGYQCAERIGATHLVLDTYVGHGLRVEHLYTKMGFVKLTAPYPDPDYLWEQGVVTYALDCGRARREWPSVHPSLYRFFTGQNGSIDHGVRQGDDLQLRRAFRPQPRRLHPTRASAR
jgi:GNAT superfamily N-acetyltransferase